MIRSTAFIHPVNEVAAARARRWLLLAVSAVAISGLFAILIALARVPALGTLFPGTEFYRTALVLHVNLSQGVWFMAFVAVLWSLVAVTESERIDRASWLLAVLGVSGITLSVLSGKAPPIMSNYLPVLDNALFLGGLSLLGLGIMLKAISAWVGVPFWSPEGGLASLQSTLLRLAAAETLAVFVLLALTWWQMTGQTGYLFFETLFWGAGHLWQFTLAGLLMCCWLMLAPKAAGRIAPGFLRLLVGVSLLPVVAGLAVPLLHAPDETAHTYLYTWLMQWMSWQAPLLLGCMVALLAPRGGLAPGYGLSLLLFVAGLLLGALINGQTTLITAHYHGTIGAVTLAFMAVSYRLLPALGVSIPETRFVRLQLACYGYGILLMMGGLAGAGLMGAPRKMPGELGVTLSVETISRICLGLGGLLATIGIMMFGFMLLRRLLPPAKTAVFAS